MFQPPFLHHTAAFIARAYQSVVNNWLNFENANVDKQHYFLSIRNPFSRIILNWSYTRTAIFLLQRKHAHRF